MGGTILLIYFCLLLLPFYGEQQRGLAQQLPEEKLVVVTKQAAPFSMRDSHGNWSGISIDLWKDIAQDRNLEYELREVDLNGMVKALENNNIDLAVAALTITAEREKAFDFTHSFYTTGLSIAVIAQQRNGWLPIIRRVFSLDFLGVIAALVITLLIFGMLIWIFERKRNPQQFGGKPIQGIGSGFWWSAVTMTTVGYGDKAPVSFGGRLIGLIWMFVAIIIISSFTAAITSSLTVNQLQSNIRGPEDLPGVRVATVSSSTSEAYLQEERISYVGYDAPLDALQSLANGERDAVVYDAPILRYLVNKQFKGKIQVLSSTFSRQDYGIAFPAGSSLREPINQTMLKKIREPEWRKVLHRYLGEN